MLKFYEVVFITFGKESVHRVIGTEQQVNDWAIKEASAMGAVYNVTYICTDTLDGIKNLGNY